MRRGDAESLVPNQSWRVRAQAMQPDHDAVHLRGLERRRRVADPVVEDPRYVVVPVPDVAGHLHDAVAVRRPDRPDCYVARGCQCAMPETVTPPSYTSSSPSRTS